MKISITGKKGKKHLNLFILRGKDELIQAKVMDMDQEGGFMFKSMTYE